MLQLSSPPSPQAFVVPVVSVCLWAAAAASIAFWFLQMPKTQVNSATTVPVSVSHAPQTPSGHTARALGQPSDQPVSTAAPTSGQYKLMGVIASASGLGSALIATDGQPPKAYRVGQVVQDGLTLVSLTARQAVLKSSSTQLQLELPAADKP